MLNKKINFDFKIKSTAVCLLFLIFNSSYSNAQVPRTKSSNQNFLVKNITHTIPIYDYVVAFQLPDGWSHNLAYEKFDSNFYISEFIPKDQTLEKWTDMMTITGYKKIDLTSKQYFSALCVMTQKICGEKSTAARIIREQDNFIIALLMCGSPLNDEIGKSIHLKRDQGEMTLYKIFKEDESLYSIFYSWRGKKYDVKDDDDKNLPASMSKVKGYLVQSKSIKLCNKNNLVEDCKEYAGLAKTKNRD